MKLSGVEARLGLLGDGGPLQQAGAGSLCASREHGAVEVAFEHRRGACKIAGGVFAQHLLAKLAVGNAGAFGEGFKQGVGEHALKLPFQRGAGHVAFGGGFVGLRGKEGHK